MSMLRPEDAQALAIAKVGKAFDGVDVTKVSNPAAGADWSWAGPSMTPFKVRSVQAQLVTSNQAGTRFPVLQFKTRNGDVFMNAPGPATQSVSLTGVDSWFVGANLNAVLVNDQSAAIPDLWLPAGTIIQTTTVAIQTNDQWSGIVIAYEIPTYE